MKGTGEDIQTSRREKLKESGAGILGGPKDLNMSQLSREQGELVFQPEEA